MRRSVPTTQSPLLFRNFVGRVNRTRRIRETYQSLTPRLSTACRRIKRSAAGDPRPPRHTHSLQYVDAGTLALRRATCRAISRRHPGTARQPLRRSCRGPRPLLRASPGRTHRAGRRHPHARRSGLAGHHGYRRTTVLRLRHRRFAARPPGGEPALLRLGSQNPPLFRPPPFPPPPRKPPPPAAGRTTPPPPLR